MFFFILFILNCNYKETHQDRCNSYFRKTVYLEREIEFLEAQSGEVNRARSENRLGHKKFTIANNALAKRNLEIELELVSLFERMAKEGCFDQDIQ